MKNLIRFIALLMIFLLTFIQAAFAGSNATVGDGGVSGHGGSVDATSDKAYMTISYTLKLKDNVSGESYSLSFPSSSVFNNPNDETLVQFTSSQIAVAMINQSGLSSTDACNKYNDMLKHGVTAVVTPKIEIYYQSKGIGNPIDYITEESQVASKAGGFDPQSIKDMHNRFMIGIGNLPLLNIPTPSKGAANIVFSVNFQGASGNKIKSGYGLSFNGDAKLNISPSIGSTVTSGWDGARTVLKKVSINSFSGFNVKSSLPLIVGKNALYETLFSPANYIDCFWNIGLPSEIYDNKHLFTFKNKHNFSNSYSTEGKNVFYVPAKQPDGNYSLKVGSDVSASTTFYWETSILDDTTNNWVVIDNPSYNVPAAIKSDTEDIIVKGSMFDDDSSTSNN